MARLTKLDGAIMGDHYDLQATDRCYFWGEYTAGVGYNHSYTNQLIFNLKNGKASPFYRDRAKREVASNLLRIKNIELFTFVPVPPSKHRDDHAYDDRLMEILRLCQAKDPDVHALELVTQRQSTEASHASDERMRPDELSQLYDVDENLLGTARDKLIIFDDMLTVGSHYRAMTSAIRRVSLEFSFIGLFIARRAIDKGSTRMALT